MGCGCKGNKNNTSNLPLPNSVNRGNNVPNSIKGINSLNPNDVSPFALNYNIIDTQSLIDYINNLRVPFVIQCVLNNQFVTVSNSLVIQLNIPVSQIPNFSGNTCDTSNLQQQGQILISIISSSNNLSQCQILEIVNTFSQSVKTTLYGYVQQYIIFQKRCDSMNIYKFKSLIISLFNSNNVPIPEKTISFTIGKQGVTTIAKLNYF